MALSASRNRGNDIKASSSSEVPTNVSASCAKSPDRLQSGVAPSIRERRGIA
eukprot:CAMPEP_0115865512 /NCGR_PEP_ID=MMETSP0287-20121206/19759_1 /TAXON_ID=412157 /ORGANISM="Chrysochromulina rotalis, Strain UIO044" /LENGTH=51 /DNA_ID=CAMNT_0003320025 /DNA_START=333 /DNA_END=488 /DNA_ORIENTATION=+